MSSNIAQIMESIQGEGLLVGTRQTFIRLFECNLNCFYCDTKFHNSVDCQYYPVTGQSEIMQLIPNPISAEQTVHLIEPYINRWISLTGGEPLLNSSYINSLGKLLKNRGYYILLETNGTLYEQLEECFSQVDIISMDIKLPSAVGLELWDQHRRFLNLAKRKPCYLKIVITGREDLSEINEAIRIITDTASYIPLYLQPVTSHDESIITDYKNLLEIQALILKSLPDVRILPQIHPIMNLL